MCDNVLLLTGARGGAVGWNSVLQAGKVAGSIPLRYHWNLLFI